MPDKKSRTALMRERRLKAGIRQITLYLKDDDIDFLDKIKKDTQFSERGEVVSLLTSLIRQLPDDKYQSFVSDILSTKNAIVE